MSKASTVFIGLGGNLGDAVAVMRQAVRDLADSPGCELVRVSSLYLSHPLAGMDQPDYRNAVLQMTTTLAPLELLSRLQAIENAHGRVRTQRWGARTLDLDLLDYAGQKMQTQKLTLPHVGIHEREFVLGPWAEINGDWLLPDGETVAAWWQRCDARGMRRLTDLGEEWPWP